jgi:hypothetical protein
MRALSLTSLTSLAGLALLASCSETTAPPDPEGDVLQSPETLTASVVVNEWLPGGPFVFDGCGETFTLVGDADHLVITETVTPKGVVHSTFHIQTLGATITAEPSGDVYRSNPGAGAGAFHEDPDGNRIGWSGGATIVAKGVNVDKRLKYKEQRKVVVTPDGKVVHLDYLVINVECQ